MPFVDTGPEWPVTVKAVPFEFESLVKTLPVTVAPLDELLKSSVNPFVEIALDGNTV